MPPITSRKGYDFSQLTYDVIGACIDVQRQLGVHCMEVDYQRALELAFKKKGIGYQHEVDIPITYDGTVVTKRRVDFVIGEEKDSLILEIKARHEIAPEDFEQALLYLSRGDYRLCLLVNFGHKPIEIKRLKNSMGRKGAV